MTNCSDVALAASSSCQDPKVPPVDTSSGIEMSANRLVAGLAARDADGPGARSARHPDPVAGQTCCGVHRVADYLLLIPRHLITGLVISPSLSRFAIHEERTVSRPAAVAPRCLAADVQCRSRTYSLYAAPGMTRTGIPLWEGGVPRAVPLSPADRLPGPPNHPTG